MYQELGLESLKGRRCLRRLCYLHKVLSTKLPTYFYELIPPIINSHRNPGCYRALYYRTDLFRNSFLLFIITEWNKLDPDIRNLDSHEMFCKKLLNFIWPSEKSIFNIYYPKGSKLLNRLGLGFSYLREHEFRHNFADTANPLCLCQGHIQNLKEVPQNFTEVFNIDDVADDDVMQRNQHCKQKALEFHSNHWCWFFFVSIARTLS